MASKSTQKKCMLRSTDNVYVCSVCQKVQTSLKRMKEHVRTHKVFQCEICLSSFKMKLQLKKHIVIHHKKAGYACPICKKTFVHVRYLEQHLNVHSSVKRFICEVCGKQFTQLAHLKSHSATHQSHKEFSCPLCYKQFSCKGSLLRHCQVHTKEVEYKCKECNKRFTRKDSLLQHVKVVHEHRKINKCHQCDLVFPLKCYLKAHRKKQHSRNAIQKPAIKRDSANLCGLRKDVHVERKVNFSVSVLKGRGENREDKTSNNHHKELTSENYNSKTILSSSTTSTSNKISTLKNDETITETVDACSESNPRISNGSLNIVPSVLLCDSDIKDTVSKRDKECNESLTLFSDSDVCEILDVSLTSFAADFFFDSFSGWEDEPLPVCSIDQGLVLEQNHEFNNKDFLTCISEEYFTSLQCSEHF